MSKWIPVSSGKFPKEEERVQVTYLSCYDNKPMCGAFAFRREGVWVWDNYEDVIVEIVAWKKFANPMTHFMTISVKSPGWSWILNLTGKLILTSTIFRRAGIVLSVRVKRILLILWTM